MRLKLKFTFLISLLIVVTVSFVTGFMFITETNFLENEMEIIRYDMIKSFANVTKDSLVGNDKISLRNYLHLLKNTKGFSYAMVMDNKNVVIMHTDSFLVGTILNDPVSNRAQNTDKFLAQKYTMENGFPILDLAYPVAISNVRIALVRIGFNRDMLAGKVTDALASIRRRILGITLLGLVVGLTGTFILTGMMVEPINIIAKGAQIIGKGNLSHVINISSDDELGDLAKAFNSMSNKLKELDQLKSDFVSSVTHELRSPLLSLRMYIDLFLKGTAGAVADKQKEYLTIMHNCAERLHHFIDDLLDIAKIERGKMEVVPKETDIVPAIRDIIQLFKPQTDNKSIKLKTDKVENLPLVKADPERTKQVLTNLLSNAVKFTPENGTITVSACVNDPLGRLEISVIDTGIGVPKDKLVSIFNKFEQVKIARDYITGPKGTGLGLAIIKGLVEAQGGVLWVQSELNEGSIFTFTLPLVNNRQ
ncbi:MAG: HAMP domain-containing protein [Elusimicrobia bacterium]|nr:HAMP domain-containing protein [Candidatus Liberimonas magnetica]